MFFNKKRKEELGKFHFDEYKVIPFESVNGIKFGTLRKEIIEIIGEPKIHRENTYSSGFTDYYDEFFISYDKDDKFEAIQVIMLEDKQGKNFDIYYDEDVLPNDYYLLVKYFRNRYNDLIFEDGFFSVKGSVGVTITQGYKNAEAIFFAKKDYYSKKDFEDIDSKGELYAINYNYDRVIFSESTNDNDKVLDRIKDLISFSGIDIKDKEAYREFIKDLVSNHDGIEITANMQIKDILNKIILLLDKYNSEKKLNATEIENRYISELSNNYINGFNIEKSDNYEILETNTISDELSKIGYDIIGFSYNYENDVLIVIKL